MIGLKQKEIDSLGKWYQTIDFGKYGKSKGSAKNLDKKWDLIKEALPYSLHDKSVLDLGCNAGYFMIKTARERALKITGIEKDESFYTQCLFTINMFWKGEVESQTLDTKYFLNSNFDIINMPASSFDFKETYDITFAFNFFYWLTYTDEQGSIENPEDVLLRFLKKLSFHTNYLLILGAEGVAKERAKKKVNNLGTSLKRTLPFLEPYFYICSAKIFAEGKKESNIILCRAKEH